MEFVKPPLSYADQAALLIERGLVVSDPNVLMRQLEAVGYYRLCAYWHPFKQADSSFVPGTSFDAVWNRYVFDRQLRLAVMDAIERVEIAIRTALVNRARDATRCLRARRSEGTSRAPIRRVMLAFSKNFESRRNVAESSLSSISKRRTTSSPICRFGPQWRR